MICQSIYDSVDAIPDNLVGEFDQINGKWQLKNDAIPGVGALFNKGLADNEKKAVDQVKARNIRIINLEAEKAVMETERDTLKDQLSVVQQPGAKVLSKEDVENWDKYTNLGTPKDLETKLLSLESLELKTQQYELRSAIEKLAKETKINPDVLTDWANSEDGKNLEFFTSETKVRDAKGVETVEKVPMVTISTDEAGKITKSQRNLLEYAKEKMPDWKYSALMTVKDTEVLTSSSNKKAAAPTGTGIILPNLGSSNGALVVDQGVRPVDRFNAERAAKPNPLRPVQPAALK